MRIAFNSHYLHRKLSGLGRYTSQVAAALQAGGLHLLEVRPFGFLYRGGKLRQALRFLTLAFCELLLPPLLLGFGFAATHVSPAFSAPLWLWSTRFIVVVHDVAFVDFPACYSRLERLYLSLNLWLLKRGRHRIVVPSSYVGEQLARRFSIDPHRITVISPYSEFDSADRVPHAAANRYFLLLSNGHPRKNITATVAGFLASRAPEVGYRLLIVGNFERQPQHESAHIEVRAGVDHAGLAQLFSGAEALLLFSLSEGFGYPVVEAARFELSALTSEVSSLAELVDPERKAEPALTEAQIRAKIDRFLADPDFRSILHKDIEHVNRTYTRDRFECHWRELVCAE